MNLKEITEQVVTLSLECGAFIRKEAETFDYEHVELKGKNDLVSYVDKETEKMSIMRIARDNRFLALILVVIFPPFFLFFFLNS